MFRLRSIAAAGMVACCVFVAGQAHAAEADIPDFAIYKTDKLAFLSARNEHISLLRGMPHFQPEDPRIEAIRQLETMEQGQQRIGNGFWTEVGPAPIPNGQTQAPSSPVSGRTIAIAVHPTNPDIVYVGTAQGGLYRSLDGGVNWTQLFNNALSLAVGALALAPSDPEILYVGTGEANGSADSFFGVGLYRINNASTTATLTGPINPLVTTGIAGTTAFTGRSISEIIVHPTNPATIFVATFTGIGGNPQAGSLGFTVPPLALLGVYRSTNATGAAPTFTKLTVTSGGSVAPDTTGNLSIADIAIDPTDANTMIAWANGAAAANNGGIYRSTNALAAAPVFTQVLTTTTANARGELAGNRVGAVTTFYAATGESNGRLRRSNDGGATWSAFLTGGQNFCNPQCFYDIAIDVHPTNADILNLGGSPTLIQVRSIDGGASFTTNALTAAGLHVDTHAITIARSNPNIVYFGSDGGIWRSADAGLTWVNRNNNQFSATQFQSLDLHPTNREFMIGGTQDNGTVMKRADGSWTRADFGDGGYALIDQNAADTINVVMYHTYFNQTSAMGFARALTVATAVDNGWTGFGCGFAGFAANGITCPASAILFYAPMARGPGTPNNTIYFGSDRLYRSADRGVTMPPVSQVLVANQAITTIGISPVSDNARIAGTRNGRVFATTTGANPLLDVTNAGMPVPNPADTQLRRPVSRAVFHPTDANTAWVAFGGYGVAAGQHIWKTTNLAGGAATWAPSGTGIPDVPVNSLTVDPADGDQIYAATDIGVFVSIDGGANWVPYSESLPRVAVFDIAFQNSTPRVLRIATHGRGIWERTPLPTSIDLIFANGFQ